MSTLTRKHFIKLAKIMQRIHREANAQNPRQNLVRLMEDELVEFCKAENSNFDTQRFLEACHNNGAEVRIG